LRNAFVAGVSGPVRRTRTTGRRVPGRIGRNTQDPIIDVEIGCLVAALRVVQHSFVLVRVTGDSVRPANTDSRAPTLTTSRQPPCRPVTS
jgi:hypothetical protein